jgi:hypothetical protein
MAMEEGRTSYEEIMLKRGGKTHIVTREALGMYIDPEASSECRIYLETLVQQVLESRLLSAFTCPWGNNALYIVVTRNG